MSGSTAGTWEFDVIKYNYDSESSLINVQEIPYPIFVSGFIKERLFLDSDNIGTLRFAADSLNSITDVTGNTFISLTRRTVLSSGVQLSTTRAVKPVSSVKITNPDIGPQNTLVVEYTPRYNIFLLDDRTATLADNRDSENSLSSMPVLIKASPYINNKTVDTSDMYLRIIIRRNATDSFVSPKLTDVSLMVGESDLDRFII